MPEWREKDEQVKHDDALERMARSKGEVCGFCGTALQPVEFGGTMYGKAACSHCLGMEERI